MNGDMTGARPQVSIIIVNYNAADVLPACLDSLKAQPPTLPSEVWVVDNASTDGSVALLRDRYAWVRLIASERNLGFAGANNLAAGRAEGDYLLLLNPDTVAPAGAVAALAQFAEANPQAAAVGPRLINADGSGQRSAWRGYPGLAMALSDALYLWKAPGLPLARLSEYQTGELTQPREVDHLLGACLLIRRAAWDKVGGLDDRFFLFLEETDWCFRARQQGWRVMYNPEVRITHLGEHSMNQNPQRNLPEFYRSYCRFYRKHAGTARWQLGLLKGIIALAALVRIGLWQWRQAQRTGAEQAQARAMQAGYVGVLRQLPGY